MIIRRAPDWALIGGSVSSPRHRVWLKLKQDSKTRKCRMGGMGILSLSVAASST
jgi:hypothetical protein